MNIEFHRSIPADLKPLIRTRISRFRYLFPSWVTELIVYYENDTGEDILLTCSPNYPYRSMSVTVFPLFFGETDDGEKAMIHEIGHGIIRPYTHIVDRVLKKYLTNEDLAQYISEELADAEEAVVQDLADFVEKLRETL